MEEQRRNVLALAFCTGLRWSSIERLQCNSFRMSVVEDGRKKVEFIIANMKNLPAEIDRCDAALYHQVIMESDDDIGCPVKAIERQLAMVQELAREGEDVSATPLFPSVLHFSLKVRKTAASREFSRGVARWVSDIGVVP